MGTVCPDAPAITAIITSATIALRITPPLQARVTIAQVTDGLCHGAGFL
jgi:hypothetical protein